MLNYSRRQVLPLMLAAAAMPRVATAQPTKYRAGDCARAIRRGLGYLHQVSIDNANFAAFGHDAIWTFLDLTRSSDPEVRQRARVIGQELARRWLRENARIPENAPAHTLDRFCMGLFSADRVGVPSLRLKEQLGNAAKRFGPMDFLSFDPRKEPPPDDLSNPCGNCFTQNARGQLLCSTCGAPVRFQDRYDVLTGALISSYAWERSGLTYGVPLGEAAQHLPSMRPYRGYENGRNPSFTQIAYAVTHVVYVFNDYFVYRLKPEWLPDEYEFLRVNLTANLSNNDYDLMGEFLDSLKSFGMTDADPLIRTGIDFLLSRQNPDGSWGMVDQSGAYTPYHATSTALNALSDFAYQEERVTFPDALRRAYAR
jgi:hypothetical protein